jgi:hypothetical protein
VPFKDSAQAANRDIYNRSVAAPAWMLLQMMLFLEAVAMVTINPFALEESVIWMLCSPPGCSAFEGTSVL